MPSKLSLNGGLIPRSVRRMFDERAEPRLELGGEMQTAVMTHRGRNHVVRVGNISSSGAMILYPDIPHIGEAVTLQLLDHGAVAGQVRWVRGGRVGIYFTAPLE